MDGKAGIVGHEAARGSAGQRWILGLVDTSKIVMVPSSTARWTDTRSFCHVQSATLRDRGIAQGYGNQRHTRAKQRRSEDGAHSGAARKAG